MERAPAFKAVGRRLSNWGRWGPEDQLGTLNHLTPERVARAAALVQGGRRFELSIPLGKDGPHTQTRAGVRVNPLHLMGVLPGDIDLPDGVQVADDYLVLPLQAGTQWDGLTHVAYDDRCYNDVPVSSIRARTGADRNAIDAVLPGFAGRGVLVDLPRLHGRRWLDPDHRVEPDELEAALAAQRVDLEAGDVLLVRTGWRRKALVEGWEGWLDVEPGLSLDCAEWLHRHDVCAVASDNWGIEVAPARGDEGFLPLHCVLIRDMGMMLGEMWDLEELAADCAADGRWSFFLVAPPLRITGGVGSPVSPVAIK